VDDLLIRSPNPREIQAPGMGLNVLAHHQWMIRSSAHPLFHLDPPTQGALESKRDPGTWNGTQCAGPPPVDDPLIFSPTVQPMTHPPRVLWNPREIQAPGMGLDVLAHHQWMIGSSDHTTVPPGPTHPGCSGIQERSRHLEWDSMCWPTTSG
jgi:hypothetical protein